MNPAAQVLLAVGGLLILAAGAVVVVRFARTVRIGIGNISAEFRNNGGSSLRDAVDRVEAKVDDLVATVRDHEQRIKRLENPPKPRAPRKKAA